MVNGIRSAPPPPTPPHPESLDPPVLMIKYQTNNSSVVGYLQDLVRDYPVYDTVRTK